MWLATGMTPCPGTSWGRDSVVAERGIPGYGHVYFVKSVFRV